MRQASRQVLEAMDIATGCDGKWTWLGKLHGTCARSGGKPTTWPRMVEAMEIAIDAMESGAKQTLG